jgi:hypothetical protein
MQGSGMESYPTEMPKQIRHACYAGLGTHNISD